MMKNINKKALLEETFLDSIGDSGTTRKVNRKVNNSASILKNRKQFLIDNVLASDDKFFRGNPKRYIKEIDKAFVDYASDKKKLPNIDIRAPKLLLISSTRLENENDFKNINLNFVGLKYSSNQYYTESIYNNIGAIDLKFKKILKPDENLLKFIQSNIHAKTKNLFSGHTTTINNIKNLLQTLPVDLRFESRLGSDHQTIIKYKFPVIKNTLTQTYKGIYEKLIDKGTKGDLYIITYFDDKYIFFKDDVIKNLENILNLVLGNDIKKFKEQKTKAENIKKNIVLPEVKNIKNFNAVLYPHQEEGVSWLLNQYYAKTPGIILADDVGMGKTIQSIAFAKLSKLKDVVVVCPASVISVWEKEIKLFYPELLKNTKIYSYESFIGTKIAKTDLLILDEIQKVKNDKTQAHKKIGTIDKKFIILLSGTPIENKVQDLFNVMYFINPVFSQIFNKLKKIGKQENFLASIARKFIDGFYLRRIKTKNELKADLIHKTILIPASQSEKLIHNEIKKFYGNKLIKAKSDNNLSYYNDVIISLMRMRQLTSDIKMLRHESYVKDYINARTVISSKFEKTKELITSFKENDKIIIFCSFSSTIQMFKKKYPNAFIIEGSTPSGKRGKIINDFQESLLPKSIILISLKAGNAGITLNNANKVIIYDLWWNPAVLHQAIARAYRIGQTRDVTAFLMVTKDTIDENILKILDFKKEIINTFNNQEANVSKKQEDNAIKQLAKMIF